MVGKFGHKKHLPGKDLDSVGRNSKESVVAVGKKFGMVESNFIIKNAYFGVNKFAIRM